MKSSLNSKSEVDPKTIKNKTDAFNESEGNRLLSFSIFESKKEIKYLPGL
jgi:hypothetical protein